MGAAHPPILPPLPPPSTPVVVLRLAFAHPPAAGGAVGWSATVHGVACRRPPPSRFGGSSAGRGAGWCRRRVAVPIVAVTPPATAGGRSGGGAGDVAAPSPPRPRDTATLTLVILNAAVYGVYRARLAPRLLRCLFLDHMRPRWWQLVTSTFCHFSSAHLSSNLFFLLLFGRLVEEEAGPWGLALVYVVCGAAANAVSLAILPATTLSAGASGAVFALFVVALLLRSRWGVRGLVEAAVLGQFVVKSVRDEAQSALIASQAPGGLGGASVNHAAHLAGALTGVLLLWGLRTLVRAMERTKESAKGSGEPPRFLPPKGPDQFR